jgi:hypothetical protein
MNDEKGFVEELGGFSPLMLDEDLTGKKVRNLEGEDVGKIEHLMIDVAQGRIAYAVLSFGGFLGMGDKLFAVPWESLSLDPDQSEFVLAVNKERLKNAPGFDKGNWPNMTESQWRDEVTSYYA